MNTKTKIKITATLLIIYGICRFLPFITIAKHFFGIRPISNLLLNILDILIFPLGFIAGGVLTLSFKDMGRMVLFLILCFDFTIRLFVIVNFWYQALHIIPTISASPEFSVQFPIAWPMYIIAAFELIFLLYFAHPKIQEHFK